MFCCNSHQTLLHYKIFQITIEDLKLIKPLATIFRQTASETNTDSKSHINVFLDI